MLLESYEQVDFSVVLVSFYVGHVKWLFRRVLLTHNPTSNAPLFSKHDSRLSRPL